MSSQPQSSTVPVTPAGAVATWLRAVRAPSLSATFAPCLAIGLYGVGAEWAIAPLTTLLAAVGVLAVQIGVNLLNDVEDDARGIDRPGTLGGSGVIQAGALSAAAIRRAAWLAFAIGALAGLPAVIAHPELAGLVAVAALGAWGYSSGPGLKYRALGDVAVLALCGPVLTVGFALAAFGRVDIGVVGLGLAFGWAAVGILHVNNFQDMQVDAGRGARTVALALGRTGSRAYLFAVYALALASWPIVAAAIGLSWPVVIVPLVATLPVGSLLRRLLRASARDLDGLQAPALALVRVDAAKAHLALGAAIALGLALSL